MTAAPSTPPGDRRSSSRASLSGRSQKGGIKPDLRRPSVTFKLTLTRMAGNHPACLRVDSLCRQLSLMAPDISASRNRSCAGRPGGGVLAASRVPMKPVARLDRDDVQPAGVALGRPLSCVCNGGTPMTAVCGVADVVILAAGAGDAHRRSLAMTQDWRRRTTIPGSIGNLPDDWRAEHALSFIARWRGACGDGVHQFFLGDSPP